MPELPEIEAFKSYIQQHCMHKEIADIVIQTPKIIQAISPITFKKELVGKTFHRVKRLGKYVIITLMPSHEQLVMHFALTGSLRFVKNKKTPIAFSAITYVFKDNSALHFTSVRKFEKTWLVDDLSSIASIKNLGPDALSIDLALLKKIIEKQSSKNIKAILLDQKIIAGIGNEYADEILYQAKIDPHHACKELSSAQIIALHTKMLQVLKHAIELRVKASATALEEQSPLSGDFEPNYLQAHRHRDMLCPNDTKHELMKAKIAGRTTYYCPFEQK